MKTKLIPVNVILSFAAISFLVSLCCPCGIADDASARLAEAGRCYQEAQRLWQPDTEDGKKAMILLDKALKLDPGNSEFHAFKANCLLQTDDDVRGALAQIDQSLAAYPEKPGYLGIRASILARINRLPEALASISKAIRNSSDPSAYMFDEKAEIFHSMGDYKGAEEAMTQCLKREPNNFDYRIARARFRDKLKNSTGAIEDASVILKDRHHSTSARLIIEAYLVRARAYARTKKNELAKQDYLLLYVEAPDVRTAMVEARGFFQSIGDKKDTDLINERIKHMDRDFQMPK